MNFSQRSYELELLDQENIPKQDLYQNLIELNTINSLLGGHAVTLKAIKSFQLQTNKSYRILDIGCGGGDNLIYIAKWARKNNLSLQLIGVDLKKDCIEFAQNRCKDYPEISFIEKDYRLLKNSPQKYNIIFSALFCHHFKEHDLQELMAFKKDNSTLGFFINDLHRHALAYYSISWLTQLFSKSYLVKNDARLSVKRGFNKKELAALLPKSKQLSLKWVWAFRWLAIYKHT
jgi:2-polyprenyl-3-methyl-5-hydroxy-6-metoxy-1,4-benzoquinol methylase